MAKLVIGTDKTVVVPAVVKEVGPAHYIEKTVDANGKLINSTNIINLNGVADVGSYALAYAYYSASFPANTSVDLSGLTTISGSYACYYMFQYCTGITGVDLSGITAISGSFAFQYMFQGCTSLATVYIGGTTAINFGTKKNQFQYMFQDCPQNIDVYAPAASQAKIESLSGYPNFGATGNVTWHWNTAE